MKQKRQTPAKPARSESDVVMLVRRWVGEGGLSQELFEICREIAVHVLGAAGKKPNTLNELAVETALDFLLELRFSGNSAVETKYQIKKLMSRWLTARAAPANHELWQIVSEVLHDLAKTGFVRRLGADASEGNTNWSRYSILGPDQDGRPFDEAAFDVTVAKIHWDFPKRQASAQTTKTPRVLAPSQAKQLILQLLQAAGGPILFKAIFDAVRKRVPLFQEVPSAPATDDPDTEWEPVSITDPDQYLWLHEESREVTNRIWADIEKKRLHETLCGYYLPKHVWNQKRRLQDFGVLQREHEKVSELESVFRRELRIERCGPESDEFMFQALRLLTALALDQLLERCRKCSENQVNKPL